MILDRLPAHITGFFDRSAPPRALDSQAFEAACHLVAQMEDGSVETLDFQLVARSYYVATVRTSSDHLSVLCNSVYPYLAFVPPGAFGFTDLEFVAPVSLASTFSGLTEFRSLDANWLMTDLQPAHLADLASVELRQIKYWKPHRIGEVIFNRWD